MLDLIETENFARIHVDSLRLYATNACCVKVNPEDCDWFLDGDLKPMWF